MRQLVATTSASRAADRARRTALSGFLRSLDPQHPHERRVLLLEWDDVDDAEAATVADKRTYQAAGLCPYQAARLGPACRACQGTCL
jgi:hypothetical protein